MNFLRLLIFVFLSFTIQAVEILHTKFCVIGFGPAGILSTCTLIDYGVDPCDILVIDSDFCGGRFGKYYQDIRLITNNKHNARYLTASATIERFAHDYLETTAAYPYVLPLIGEFVAALQQISIQLFNLGINKLQTTARALDGHEFAWRIITDDAIIECEYLVLALGWQPMRLHYPNLEEIPLDFAMTPQAVARFIQHGDRIAVFGDGKSAQLVIQALLKCGITEITSVVPEGCFSVQGALYCARYSDKELLKIALQQCNKVVYAIGYEENKLEAMNDEIAAFFASEDKHRTGIVRVAEQGVVGTMLSIQESFPQLFANISYN